MKNADKYKTAKERNDAFHKFCLGRKSCIGCELNAKRHEFGCSFNWLELEAEGGMPLPCPFCGKYTYTVDYDFLGYWGVKCSADGCWYHSHLCKTESEAIAAHNSVVKAVMAAKKGE